MVTKKTESVAIEIPQLKMETAIIHVKGDTPLIVHKWSEKAKKEIRDKQMKKATTKKEAKDPVADFIDTLYWLDGEPEDKTMEGFEKALANGARFGFPATGFKQCAIMGAYRLGADIKTTVAKAAIIIPCEYIEIKGKAITQREDMVKIGSASKVADIRYRAQIEDWEADIPVKFCSSVMSLEQVVNLFNMGGFACGVGEWRNEKNGIFGAFHVEGV